MNRIIIITDVQSLIVSLQHMNNQKNIDLTILARRNADSKDKDIQFTERGHVYTILSDPTTKYASATGWVKENFGKFDADEVIRNIYGGKNWNSTNKYWGMKPSQIKAQWKVTGDEACAAGTQLHERIEYFMNHSALYPEYTHAELYADYIARTPTPIANEVLEWQWFLHFIQQTPHLKPYRTEWMIYDQSVAIAGSIDMIYENNDGSLSIYDWKRCKEIDPDPRWKKYSTNPDPDLAHIIDTNYWHYSMQLNVYRHILETQYNKTIKDLFLVRFHPDSADYELIQVPRMEREMEAFFAQRRANINLG